MKNSLMKIYLFIAGLIVILVGSYMAFMTHTYVQTMDPNIAQSAPSLLSDLRGLGGLLLVVGGYVLVGNLRSAWQQGSLYAATALYTSFSLFRSLGFILDGFPGTAVMIAYALEVLLMGIGIYLVCKRMSERA